MGSRESEQSAATVANRRQFLAAGGVGSIGAALATPVILGQTGRAGSGETARAGTAAPSAVHNMGSFGTVGDVLPDEYFDATRYLTTWNSAPLPGKIPPRDGWDSTRFYRESRRPDGSRVREYQFVAVDREIEIAPGLYFPAWTYNGQVPGPTIRATEGDRIRIRFINQGSHPHTIHFHGWHTVAMDGSLADQFVNPGQEFVYEFDAEPVGLHLYHCHSVPLKRHIHKGLYGVFMVDPRPERYEGRLQEVARSRNPDYPEHRDVRELVMAMNAFDTTFDAENEVYAVNTIAFHYMRHPIPVRIGQLVRVYLVNITEFDPINSFHLHAGFFDVFRTGTRLETTEHTDTLMLCQAERAILEFRLRYPGKYMFHAHQSEFAELGWMGMFEATEDSTLPALAGEASPDYPAPDFALPDSSGAVVRMSDFRGRSSVVLAFNLGSGCRHCARQMRMLADTAPALRARGAEIVLVTPGREELGKTPVRCVADPQAVAGKLYGTHRGAGQPLHGTFVIDRAGRVRWQHRADQPFLDGARLLSELDRIAGSTRG